MKRITFLVYFPQMLFVSYTILVFVFILIGFALGATVTYQDLLTLFVMAFFVCMWNTLIVGQKRQFLKRYIGDVVIVLGIGYLSNGFIPLEIGGSLLACAIVTIVYLGTWLYFYTAALFEAEQINRELSKRRKKGTKT